ncbi:Plasmodium variant antigen protein Cir/Yir/Bir, putative [Plasmodium chabaudi chabaudi]|uniref:Plasmodium variant antigen protein Cir/Yir/Bir, putative n=1 Tax=Plasmodium chabaudi chabaudi TaxID=31271 RepID=A0A1D3LA20_PLACU|nr:Plasmodium variant antigen protein Cir/Yir/Bir, putative [Plasmodium chabaudi chabaudi]
MLKEVCEAINSIDALIKVEVINKVTYFNSDEILDIYCAYKTHDGKKACYSYPEMVTFSFISFLKYFESVEDVEKLESDKLAEYVILWLSYKIHQHQHNNIITLKDFYDNYLKGNDKYNEEINGNTDNKIDKGLIDKKINSMAIDIKEMSKYYDPFKSLCNMYNEFDGNNSDCKKCSQKANEFVENYKKLNGDSGIDKDSPYYRVLCTLSNDYNNLKSKCSDFQTLPPIKIAQSYVQDSRQSSLQTYDGTSSSSSIANTLIPVLSIFVAIPVFLGISYSIHYLELINGSKDNI